MCGIYCTVGRVANAIISENAAALLQRRGPDCCEARCADIRSQQVAADVIYLTLQASVLSLRGGHIAAQPLVDLYSDHLLCWNGEAWEIDSSEVLGNDSELIFQKLLQCTNQSGSNESAHLNTVRLLSSIRGPYAFVFLDLVRSKLYFARDCLGRRSLVTAEDRAGNLIIASVPDLTLGLAWTEVEADGVYYLDFAHSPADGRVSWAHNHVLQEHQNEVRKIGSLILPFTTLNKSLPEAGEHNLNDLSNSVRTLRTLLLRSLKLRITSINKVQVISSEAQFAVLFSGGLDCTLLTALSHDILPGGSSIDLLNVAFENPRIHKAGIHSPYEICPDRITARASFIELCKAFPSLKFRLICINIPFTETAAHRQTIIDLMHPHNTEMDFSIACALYFAARAIGVDGTTGEACTSTARVLLSGLGADELFGGYQRHAIAYTRNGFEGLIEELDLDFSRLGRRNLGRDDRVISHWGKEARYPYLDENVVAWALQTPVWLKTGFGHDTLTAETTALAKTEPGKLILRLMADELGLYNVAKEKKRAVSVTIVDLFRAS